MGGREELTYKVVIIGDGEVGKSNLTLRFTKDEFESVTHRTHGTDFVDKEIVVDGRDVTLDLFDTAGQEKYGPIVKSTFNGSHGALVVFDLTRRETYDHVQQWISDFRERAGQAPICILVGNKSDRKDDREVEAHEAQWYAKENGMCYFETSAKEGDNVDKVFHFLGREIFRSVSDGTVIRERHGRQGPPVIIPVKPQEDSTKKKDKKCKC